MLCVELERLGYSVRDDRMCVRKNSLHLKRGCDMISTEQMFEKTGGGRISC